MQPVWVRADVLNSLARKCRMAIKISRSEECSPLDRWFSGPLSKVDRDLDREHREIAEAALSRDSERAVALMNEHLQMTARVILDSVLSGREPAPKSAKAKPGEAYVPEGLPRKLKRGASSA